MKHAEKLRPKFQAVITMLDKELKDADIATWTNPKGGYFISFDVMEGCAKKVVQMCKKAGMVLTGAGATYPYGKDPEDKNIRIAPSFPSPEELVEASKILIVCTKIATIEKMLDKFVKKYIDPNAPGGKEHVGYIIDRVGFAEYKRWALDGVVLPQETIVKDNIYWSGIHY